MKIEIMDTTLRDGEQTSGVSFSAKEKLTMAQMFLQELKVDRIEIASAGVSSGEYEAVKQIIDWAKKNKHIDKIEILGFVDGKRSLDWIKQAGGKYINLLTKGSLKHVTGQLRQTPEQHVENIKSSVSYAQALGISVNVYLEDWSNGIKESADYVYFLMDALKDLPIKRYMLPDTLGVLNPYETYDYIKAITDKHPTLHFDFHAHNDYDLATANCLAAVKAGAKGLHVTVNGLGERTGNAPLSSVVAALNDHMQAKLRVTESKLNEVSKLVAAFSGMRIPANKPIIGENVFTQTCGVHADGDSKGNLYFNDLMPERFGRTREYALGKTSGKASIKKNLEKLGIVLDEESMRKVTQRVIELGDKKETITTEDLPYIIADVLKNHKVDQKIRITNYYLGHALGVKPVASIRMEINGKEYEGASAGDGQYDAVMNTIKKIYARIGKKLPDLVDYFVRIPPGGRTDALVETVITWQQADFTTFKTKGLNPDQTAAAIEATIKMLNIMEG